GRPPAGSRELGWPARRRARARPRGERDDPGRPCPRGADRRRPGLPPPRGSRRAVTRVLVVAAGAEARARLDGMIRGRPGLRLLVAPPGGPLARQVAAMQADVVVLDLEIDLLRAVAATPGAPPIIALTAERGGPARADLRRAGARGVLPRTAT